jgi:hypothetical protein
MREANGTAKRKCGNEDSDARFVRAIVCEQEMQDLY